jgi:hypothetical protein
MEIEVLEMKMAVGVIRSRAAVSPGDLRKVLRISDPYQSITTDSRYSWNGITPLSRNQQDTEEDERLNKSISLTSRQSCEHGHGRRISESSVRLDHRMGFPASVENHDHEGTDLAHPESQRETIADRFPECKEGPADLNHHKTTQENVQLAPKTQIQIECAEEREWIQSSTHKANSQSHTINRRR